MSLNLQQVDHGVLCHGWTWTISDQDALAEQVARIALGQYRHVAKILNGVGVSTLGASAEQARAAIEHLTLKPDADPWHRDGWIFQAISWIAANIEPAGSLTRAPHIRKADKGFDGIQIDLSADGTSVTAVVIFEDKATDNARKTVREDVWTGIEALERGQRLNELAQEVSGMLDARAATDADFDVDAAIASILWNEARRYRVSITIGDHHNKAANRAGLFAGYDEMAPGDVARRRAETLHLPQLRDWMDKFANLIVQKIRTIASV